MAARRDGAERREALLDAALVCFSRDGVLGVGIEQVRREAGASPSSVYHLFRGIDDLTLALLCRTFESLFAHLATRVGRTRTAKGAVTTLVAAHLEWVIANQKEARFMYQAMALELAPEIGERLSVHKELHLRPLVGHLTPHLATGALPQWSPLVFDVVLMGATHEACRRWLAGAALEPDWMRRELPRLAWATAKAGR